MKTMTQINETYDENGNLNDIRVSYLGREFEVVAEPTGSAEYPSHTVLYADSKYYFVCDGMDLSDPYDSLIEASNEFSKFIDSI